MIHMEYYLVSFYHHDCLQESMGSLPAVIRCYPDFCRVNAERHGHQLRRRSTVFSFREAWKAISLHSFPSLFRLRKRL